MPRGESTTEPASLIEITRELVEADTVSHRGNQRVMARLGDRLRNAGFEVALQEWGEGAARKANLVARAGPAAPDGLMLSGHLDVVPFEGQPGWRHAPLALEREGDRFYGRGTADMKGFLAQCVEAASQLDTGRLRRPLLVVFTSDEEIGCRGAARLVPALLKGLLGGTPLPRLCWIGEPTSWQVFHAHKGVVSFPVTVHGKGGHSSLPEAGVNAIAVAARLLARVGEVQQELREAPRADFATVFPDAPYTTLNIGAIAGGTALNMIAERCRFDISYRPLPDEEPQKLWEQLCERLLSEPAPDRGSGQVAPRIEIGAPDVAPGLLSPRGTALARALCERLGQSTTRGAPFCTDAGRFAALGIQSIVCGPGELEQAHQPNESISRRALVEGVDHILAIVQRLCVENGGDA